MYAGESPPGIHGGICPVRTTARISFARGTASFADVSGNGAMPPRMWQAAHFPRRIGATSL